MNRKLLLHFFILLILPMVFYGQEEDLPVSWSLNIETSPEIFSFHALDMEAIMEEDRKNDLDKSKPWRYGIERDVYADIREHGLWTSVSEGGKIWQFVIHSPDAINISVNFNDIYLPEGSKLHLYNQERTDLIRPFSNLAADQNQLGTWFVEGETVWIEYYQPSSAENPRIQIESIIHGYRLGILNDREWGFEDSGACHYDVNCPVGADFDSQKDILKKAVALLNLGNGHLCTATLINTTKGDKTPYLLTANHCLETSDPSFWSVRFNWISEDPVCGEDKPSGNAFNNFTMSGAQFRASNSMTDFALVELNQSIPGSWDVAFAGWDKTDNLPAFEVGIHHPKGDIMKVCRDDSGAQKVMAVGKEIWLIGGGEQGWGNGWEIGTTESGSSGSPLFNEDGKIIGQLIAGLAACDGEQNNGEYDMYGRFAVSWEEGNSPQTRLSDWLDPENLGYETVETLQNILNVPNFEPTGDLTVFPNPASSELNILNNRYPNLTFEFYNLIGQKIYSGSLSNTFNSISVADLQEGIYIIRLIDGDSQDYMSRKVVIKR